MRCSSLNSLERDMMKDSERKDIQSLKAICNIFQQKNMEPSSNIYGDHGTEECQSSESGWTMYIGSSMDDDDGGGVYDGRKKGIMVIKDEDEDTDDSMASDASSGPSHLHLQQPWEIVQQQNQTDKNQKCSTKKNKKVKKKSGFDQESSRKKDESLVNERKGGITTLQSGNRAWFLGKKK